MARKILGLDFGKEAITATLLQRGLKGSLIEAVETVPISQEEDFENALVKAVDSIRGKMDIAGAVSVVSLPSDLVFFRNMKVPFKDAKKIRQVLPFELEPLLPLPVDDLIIDFHPLKLPEQKDQTDIIATTVEKSKIRIYLDILTDFKINPEIVTFGGYALAVCLTKLSETNGHTVVINFNGNQCTAFATVGEQIIFMRSFPVIGSSASIAKSIKSDVYRTQASIEDIYGFDFQPENIVISGNGYEGDSLEDTLSP